MPLHAPQSRSWLCRLQHPEPLCCAGGDNNRRRRRLGGGRREGGRHGRDEPRQHRRRRLAGAARGARAAGRRRAHPAARCAGALRSFVDYFIRKAWCMRGVPVVACPRDICSAPAACGPVRRSPLLHAVPIAWRTAARAPVAAPLAYACSLPVACPTPCHSWCSPAAVLLILGKQVPSDT